MTDIVLATLIQLVQYSSPPKPGRTACYWPTPERSFHTDSGRSFGVFESYVEKNTIFIGMGSYGIPYTQKDGTPFHYVDISVDNGMEILISSAKLFGEIHDSTPLYVHLANLSPGQHKIEVSLLDYMRSPILSNTFLCKIIKGP